MQFVLFDKLKDLAGLELWMLLGALVVAVILVVAILRYRKANAHAAAPARPTNTRALVYGALSVSLSFILSYVKLLEMPMGGSITLCAMLHVGDDGNIADVFVGHIYTSIFKKFSVKAQPYIIA